MTTVRALYSSPTDGEITEIGSSDEVGSAVSYSEVTNFTYDHVTTYTPPGGGSVTIDSTPNAVVFGTAMRLASTGVVSKARADFPELSEVIGLCSNYRVEDGATVAVQHRGVMQGSITQWNSVLIDLNPSGGGLIPGSTYFLDDASVGKLTLTPSTAVGATIVPIGTALSQTELLIDTFRSRIRLA